jgi:predicted GNAT family acetyltransferase
VTGDALPPIRRPASARPRAGLSLGGIAGRGDAGDSGATGDPGGLDGGLGPPSIDELLSVERQLVELEVLAGAATAAANGTTLVRWPGHGPMFNHAVQVRWGADWPTSLEALAADLRAAGERPAVLLVEGLSTPADLGERLQAAGWTLALAEQVLWTRRAAVVPHLDSRLRIEAVTAARSDAYEEVERAIFGIPETDAEDRWRSLRSALNSGGVRAYLARLDGEPIATARLHPAEGIAALGGIGVVPSQRRKGYATLITTIATRAALATGSRFVWLSVAETNAGATAVYERLDFRPAGRWELLVGP